MRRFIASMQGRVFLVLIGGIVASALLTAALADREGRRTFAQVRAAHTADRVEQLVTALEAVPPEVRPTLGGDPRPRDDGPIRHAETARRRKSMPSSRQR